MIDAIHARRSIDRSVSFVSHQFHTPPSLPHGLEQAMWVVDILALRVGGEKGEDEADTVGCCSLRKEHFSFTSTEARER